MKSRSKTATVVVLSLLLTACGGGTSDTRVPTATTADTAATGTITISLADAPVDDVHVVNVQLSGVSIKPQSAPALNFDYPEPVNVDLLSLRDGSVFDLLAEEQVPAGTYEWIRLHANADIDGVIDSYVMETSTGGQVELRVPSREMRLVSGFVVTAGRSNAFTLDWDVRKGLTHPPGQGGWVLRPAFRLIDQTLFGNLSGSVADALVQDSACTSAADGTGNLVYGYAGHDVPPDDLGSDSGPVVSAPVIVDAAAAGAYTYVIRQLDPGPYTVAFTCQGLDDDPAIDETGDEQIVFSMPVNAEVDPGRDTRNEAPLIE